MIVSVVLATEWVSLNKCVLLCNECAAIHRSLGGHVSYIKPVKLLRNSPQYKLVEAIYKCSANAVWEENLSKGLSRGSKKPSKDDKYAAKSEFIRAKYVGLNFVKRTEDVISPSELSKTLQTAVKTPHLESTLRCIIMGANVNMKNGMTGMGPVHIAAQHGLEVQVELLFVCGADVCAVDFEDRLPEQLAKDNRRMGLAARLTEMRFQVTDKLAHFISGQKPRHAKEEHLLIPRLKESACDSTRLMRNAIEKLQSLSDEQFCDLVSDLFDEVERREIDGYLVSSSSDPFETTNFNIVPFLPLNPSFSSTRNQSRQKLARFNSRELNTFIRDVLIETRRRQLQVQPEQIDLTSGELLYQEDDYDEPTLSHSLGSNAAAHASSTSGVHSSSSTRRLSYPHQHSPSSTCASGVSAVAQLPMDLSPLTPLENGGAAQMRRPNSRVGGVVPTSHFNPSALSADSPLSGVPDTLDVGAGVATGGPTRFSKHVSGASGHTSGSSPRLPFDLCPSSDAAAAAVLPPDSVSQGPDVCSSSSSSAFNETLRLALDRIKVLEVANKELEERIKTQERMILELVERNHLLSRAAVHSQPSSCGVSDLGSPPGLPWTQHQQQTSATGGLPPNATSSSHRPASLAPMHTRKESSSSSETSKRSIFSPPPPAPNANSAVSESYSGSSTAALNSSNEYNSHEYSVPNSLLAAEQYDVIVQNCSGGGSNSQSPTSKVAAPSSSNDSNTINNVSTSSDEKVSSSSRSVESCNQLSESAAAAAGGEAGGEDVTPPNQLPPPELPPKGIPAPANSLPSFSTAPDATASEPTPNRDVWQSGDSRTSGESSQSSSGGSSCAVPPPSHLAPVDSTTVHSHKQPNSSSSNNNSWATANGSSVTANHHYSSSSSSASPAVNIAKVKQKTDQLTKKIKVMWQACQDQRQESFVACSDNIRTLVTEFIALFSQSCVELHGSNLKAPLELMDNSSYRLQIECKSTFGLDELEPYTDQELIATVINQIFLCCVDIAHGIKAVVQYLQID